MIIYICLGLLIAMVGEFWRFYLIAEDPMPSTLEWSIIILSYIIILLCSYKIRKYIKRDISFYVFFGLLGVILEIVIFGTNPLAHPIIFLWVISFWGSVSLLPKLIIEKKLKIKTIIFIIISLLSTLMLFFTSKESSLLAIFYISLNIPYLFWQFNFTIRNGNDL